jgi:hypothetical protein
MWLTFLLSNVHVCSDRSIPIGIPGTLYLTTFRLVFVPHLLVHRSSGAEHGIARDAAGNANGSSRSNSGTHPTAGADGSSWAGTAGASTRVVNSRIGRKPVAVSLGGIANITIVDKLETLGIDVACKDGRTLFFTVRHLTSA